jgi:hypothetical protein
VHRQALKGLSCRPCLECFVARSCRIEYAADYHSDRPHELDWNKLPNETEQVRRTDNEDVGALLISPFSCRALEHISLPYSIGTVQYSGPHYVYDFLLHGLFMLSCKVLLPTSAMSLD